MTSKSPRRCHGDRQFPPMEDRRSGLLSLLTTSWLAVVGIAVRRLDHVKAPHGGCAHVQGLSSNQASTFEATLLLVLRAARNYSCSYCHACVLQCPFSQAKIQHGTLYFSIFNAFSDQSLMCHPLYVAPSLQWSCCSYPISYHSRRRGRPVLASATTRHILCV